MIHGCLLLVMVMAVVSTFASYNAGKPAFHMTVALLSAAGLVAVRLRLGWCAQAEALLAVLIPATICAALGYGTTLASDALMGLSSLLYVLGTGTFVVSNLRRALRSGALDAGPDADDPS